MMLLSVGCSLVVTLSSSHCTLQATKFLWEKARIFHRDVSVGNILIVEKEGSRPFTGFLHDFDYSSMAGIPLPSGSDLRLATAETLGKENLKERMVRYLKALLITYTYWWMSAGHLLLHERRAP